MTEVNDSYKGAFGQIDVQSLINWQTIKLLQIYSKRKLSERSFWWLFIDDEIWNFNDCTKAGCLHCDYRRFSPCITKKFSKTPKAQSQSVLPAQSDCSRQWSTTARSRATGAKLILHDFIFLIVPTKVLLIGFHSYKWFELQKVVILTSVKWGICLVR